MEEGIEGGAVKVSFYFPRASLQAAIVTRYRPGSSLCLVSSPSGCRPFPAWESSFVVSVGGLKQHSNDMIMFARDAMRTTTRVPSSSYSYNYEPLICATCSL